MRNVYLTVIIVCIAFIIVVGFQNLILNQNAWIFVILTNSSVLAFLCGIVGFTAGAAAMLFYNSTKQQEGEDEGLN